MKSTGLWICAFLAMPLMADAQTKSLDSYDLAGLKIGMNTNDITAAIKAFDAKMVLTTATQTDASGQSFTAIILGEDTADALPNDNGSYGEVIAAFFTEPPPQKAFMVIHGKGFRADQLLTKSDFVAALIDKFGNNPELSYYPGQMIAWSRDSMNKIIPYRSQMSKWGDCAGMRNNNLLSVPTGNLTNLKGFVRYPTSFFPFCGTSLMVEVAYATSQAGEPIVSMYSEALFDSKLAISSINYQNSVAADKKNHDVQTEQERSKSNKPRL